MSICFCMAITRQRLTALHTTLTHSSPAAAIAAIFHLRFPFLTGWFSAPGHDSSESSAFGISSASGRSSVSTGTPNSLLSSIKLSIVGTA